MRIAVLGTANQTSEFRSNIEDSVSQFATITYFSSDTEFVSEARHGMIEKAFIYVSEDSNAWLDAIRILSSDEKVGLVDISVIGKKGTKPLEDARDLLEKYKVKEILYSPIAPSDLNLEASQSAEKTSFTVDRTNASKKLSEYKDSYKKGLMDALDKVAANVVSVPDSTSIDGLLLDNKDEMIEQMTNIEKLISGDPANYSHKFSMLTYYILKEDFDRANRLFLEIHDELQALNNSTWLIELANVCIRNQCISFASISVFTLLDILEPQDQWRASILKSKLQLLVGNVEKAEVFLNEAMLGNPRPNSEMMNLKGLILKRDGDLEGSARVLKECFHKSHPDHRIAYNLALVLEKLGQRDSAEEYYKKCLDIFPDFDKAKEKLIGN